MEIQSKIDFSLTSSTLLNSTILKINKNKQKKQKKNK